MTKPKMVVPMQQRRVLQLADQGLTNPQIAAVLGLSPHTVRAHLRAVFHRLGVSGVNSRALALRRCYALGILNPAT